MSSIGAVLSSLFLTVALPNEIVPMGIGPVGAVALVPVLIGVYRTTRWRVAARTGALFGALSTALSNYWLAFFGEFSVWTIGGTILGYAAYNYVLFGYLFHLSREPRFRAVRIATLWAAYEYLKSVGFLAYPWGLIAYPGANWLPLAQIVELTGVWGLSWLMAFLNASVAELLASPGRSGAFAPPRAPAVAELPTPLGPPARDKWLTVTAALLLVAVSASFGGARLAREIPVRQAFEVLLVQQNVDSWAPGRFEDALRRAQQLTTDGVDEHGPPDLVVWSETAMRRPYLENGSYYDAYPADEPFSRFIERTGVPLVTGTPVRAGASPDFMNGALLIAPDGTAGVPYGKQQLVPFAESIPFYERDGVKRFFREVVGVYGTWVPGTKAVLFETAGVRFGTPICFEDAFGYVLRAMANGGADLFVNLTNNSWSRQRSAQTQHFAAARLRAIETRRPLVRGTNSGLTAVIDHRGRLRAEAPMFRSTVLAATVEIPEPVTTLYMRIGDLLGRAFVAVSILLTAIVAFRRRAT